MKQTTIQILIEKYNKQWDKYGLGSSISYSELIADLEQAKEMEKEQIVDARLSLDKSTPFSYASYKAEQYYNGTFKSE